jgi:diguanylate cyclase (GGDEF)-like protein
LGVIAAAHVVSLLVGAASLAAAQPAAPSPPGRLAFRVFNEDHGLGNLTVEALLQDRMGFLWVGTQNGLFRFDGRTFVAYGREAGFESTRVFALHEAADGTLYVATRAGLVRREGEGFRQLTAADGVPDAPVTDIASDGGRVYAASQAGLLVGDGRAFRTEPAPPGTAGPATAVFASGGRAYAAYEGLLFERDAEGWRDVGTDAGLPATERIDRVSADASGRLFVRTLRSLWMRPSDGAFFVPLHAGLPAAATAGRLERDAQGDVLLPTSRGVAQRMGDAWRVLGRHEGLPGDVALSALVDREGSLWVGLGGVGLAQRLGRGEFTTWGLPEGLSHEVVWSIARERGTDVLWVGTQEGLNRLDLASGGLRVFRERDGLAGDLVYALCAAPDGGVWAGSWPGGVTRLPAGGGAPRRFVAAGLTPAEFEVIALVRRADGEVWAGASRGPFRLPAGATAFQPAALAGGPPRDGVYAFAEGGDGELFAVGRGGIQRLTGETPRRFTTADGLKDDFIASIVRLPDDSFVIGYREALGVARIRVHRERLEILPLGPGDVPPGEAASPLGSDKVLFVGRDSSDQLWVGGDRGVDVFDSNGRRLRRLSRADGLPTDDMDQNAFLAGADGVVWLGTSRGLVRYRPSEPLANAAPPSVVITEVATPRRRLQPGDQPVLARDERSLTVSWSALTFRDPLGVRYRHRLEGLEDEFVTTPLTGARYAGLGAGRYRFEVVALGPDGSATAAPAAFAFSVTPPWWETLWARLGIVALTLATGAALIRLRTRALDADRRRLEEAVRTRSAELAKANEQLKEASVRDPLTQLHNRRYLTEAVAENVKRVLRAYAGAERGEPVRNQDLAFFLVDVDHFKEVNDRYGHPVGDRLLVALARRLTTVMRDSDLVVRWGGEEFLIVARETDRAEAEPLAARILESVGGAPFDLGDGVALGRTCSIGWAAVPWIRDVPAAVSWEETLVLVDRALYLAKRSGRNQAIGVMPSEHAAPDVEARWWREPFDRLEGRLRTARIAGPQAS